MARHRSPSSRSRSRSRSRSARGRGGRGSGGARASSRGCRSSRSRSRSNSVSHPRQRSRSHERRSRSRRSPRTRGGVFGAASSRSAGAPPRRSLQSSPPSPSPRQQRRRPGGSVSRSRGSSGKKATEGKPARSASSPRPHSRSKGDNGNAPVITAKAPEDNGCGQEAPPAGSMDGEVPPASFEVVDGVTKLNGDLSWRAEVSLPRPTNTRHGGKPGTINIRGPSRLDEADAKRDGEKLVEACKSGGMQAARVLQRKLNNEAIEESRRA